MRDLVRIDRTSGEEGERSSAHVSRVGLMSIAKTCMTSSESVLYTSGADNNHDLIVSLCSLYRILSFSETILQTTTSFVIKHPY